MLRVLFLVISIAIADAVNPATVAPALYLATADRPLRRLIAFTAAFFAVNFAGGVAIVLGPGQLLLTLLPDIGARARDWIEVAAGVILIIAATFLALSRGPAQPEAKGSTPSSPGRAAAMGATIAALELPTALPYFAAIAAIVGSGLALANQLALIAAFNLVFISPVLAMIGLLAMAGPGATERLRRIGSTLRARWRLAFALLAGAAGVLLIAVGATGLAGIR